MKRVLITREKKQSEELAKEIKKYGLEGIPFPTIKTVPLDFPEKDVYSYDVFVFTSKNAVYYFFKKINSSALRDKIIIAVGAKTKSYLEKLGFKKVTTPEIFSSEGLSKFFLENIDSFFNKKILIPKAKKGIDTLVKKLKGKVLDITILPVYETVLNLPENKEEVEELFEKNKIDFVIFTSPSTFENFLHIFGKKGKEYLKKSCIAVIGSTTKKAVEEKGLSVCVVPEKFTVEEVIKNILRF